MATATAPQAIRNTPGIHLDADGLGYDYTNQAWIAGGVYIRCGHPDHMDCQCFGKIHAGKPAGSVRA